MLFDNDNVQNQNLDLIKRVYELAELPEPNLTNSNNLSAKQISNISKKQQPKRFSKKISFIPAFGDTLPNGDNITQKYRNFDAVKYKGSFKNGLWHYNGTWYNSDGSIHYQGSFKKGIPFGNDIKIFDTNDNSIFEGNLYENGHGHGTITIQKNEFFVIKRIGDVIYNAKKET